MDDASFFEVELDEEEAKRSILITDVPENVSPKDVVIHFQKKSNGGGEVVNIDDHGNEHRSPVVITFEDPSIVERAIELQHIINGKEVTVQRYPAETRIPEIFSLVDARINLKVFDGSIFLLEEVLSYLKSELGIEYCENRYGYSIRGSYKQIRSCRNYIQDNIRNGKISQQMPRGCAIYGEAEEAASPEERDAISRSTETKDYKKNDAMTFQSVPIILQFIFTVSKYARRIQDIESEFNVKIGAVDGGSKVLIRPLPGCTRTKHHDACEEYIELYKEVYDSPKMSKNLLLRPGIGSDFSVKEVVMKVLLMEPVAIQEMEEQDKWLFYGEETNVRSAINAVCNMLKIDNPLRKTRKARVRQVTENDAGTAHTLPKQSGNDKAEEHAVQKHPNNVRSHIHKDFPGDTEQPCVVQTKKGFRLTVYQGDIVEERVDVIVSTTDHSLGFLAGLSKAIVDKGGRTIENEVLVENRRKRIKPGNIILTGPGKLHCLKILHLITNRQNKRTKEKCKSIANAGCLDCLRLAQKQKLTSIAFPALGTGSQDITLDTCATAMLNAVEEYMKDNDPKTGAVADIRFVHLDARAAEVFKTEITKRYGDSIVKPSGEKGYGRHTDYKTLSLPSPDYKVVSSVDKKAGKKEDDDVCPICLDEFHDPTALPKCKHTFCKKCIDLAFQHRKACPTCGMAYGVHTGNMPPGTMNHYFDSYSHLPGYERCGTIRIDYNFPSGTQGPEHPNPGQWYSGTSRTAYLPDCQEGREVLDLLKKAFNARLTFTIGRSVTTGVSNVVTWNDIHHKTNPYGGATGFGYPDPTYLKRVKAELAAKGIK